MRTSMITAAWLALLMGCAGETQFSNTPDTTVAETGVAMLELSTDSLIIEEVNYADQISKSATFSITNGGDNTLQLYLVGLADSGDGAFYIEEETDLALQPGVSREFSVVATLSEFVSAEGSLRIRSSDSGYIDHRLPVTAYPAGWDADGGSDTGSGSGGSDTGSGGGSDTGSESGASDTGTAG